MYTEQVNKLSSKNGTTTKKAKKVSTIIIIAYLLSETKERKIALFGLDREKKMGIKKAKASYRVCVRYIHKVMRAKTQIRFLFRQKNITWLHEIVNAN